MAAQMERGEIRANGERDSRVGWLETADGSRYRRREPEMGAALRPLASLLAIVLGLTLAHCASNYEVSPEVRKAEWEAKNIYPAAYRAEIIAYLRNYLNDPTNVRDAMVSEPMLKPMGLGNRFVSCVRFASRHGSDGNAAGGRENAVGREHAAIFVGGKLDAYQEVKDANKDRCAGAVYGPFPELEKLTR